MSSTPGVVQVMEQFPLFWKPSVHEVSKGSEKSCSKQVLQKLGFIKCFSPFPATEPSFEENAS